VFFHNLDDMKGPLYTAAVKKATLPKEEDGAMATKKGKKLIAGGLSEGRKSSTKKRLGPEPLKKEKGDTDEDGKDYLKKRKHYGQDGVFFSGGSKLNRNPERGKKSSWQ